jgi:choline dehydrogenase-like flavoprotein
MSRGDVFEKKPTGAWRLTGRAVQHREVPMPFVVQRPGYIISPYFAGHPGGMLPLTAAEAASLHPARLPTNLYVADASLLPRSLGNPPILTLLALAKKVARAALAAAAERPSKAPGQLLTA